MSEEPSSFNIERRRLTLIGGVDSDMLRAVCIAFDAFEAASQRLPITITFCSDGGESYVALGIYDRIKASPCKVTIEALGEVMSAGTVILQAAYKRLLYPNTTFLIHYGTTSITSDSTPPSVISQAAFEKHIDSPRMEDIYLERTRGKLSRKKLKEYLSVDSLFSASRAIELGFADAIIGAPARRGKRGNK